MAAVTIKNLTKSYDGVQVLKELNVRFQDGEFVTLLGPSGCGKTTILRLLAGFEQPSSGEIWIGDTLVSGGKTLLPPEKRNIGMVFQSYAVWPHMTVEENAAYPLRIRRMPKAETAERVEAMLRTVHLDQYAKRLPSQLSGGQQQRVALARALLAEPSLLLLDEPLSNLDAKLRESMRFEIKDLAREMVRRFEAMGIRVNKRKTKIIPLTKPFRFCKSKFTLRESGKVTVNACRDGIKRARRKLKFFLREIKEGRRSPEDAAVYMQSQDAYYRKYNDHGRLLRLRRMYYAIFTGGTPCTGSSMKPAVSV